LRCDDRIETNKAFGTQVTARAHELQRSGKRYGIASACVGGGQGIAMPIETPEAGSKS